MFISYIHSISFFKCWSVYMFILGHFSTLKTCLKTPVFSFMHLHSVLLFWMQECVLRELILCSLLLVNVIWRGVLPVVAAELQAWIALMVGIFLNVEFACGSGGMLKKCFCFFFHIIFNSHYYLNERVKLTVLILQGSSGLYLRVLVTPIK